VPEPTLQESWFKPDRVLSYACHQRFFDFNPGAGPGPDDDTLRPFRLTKLRRASDLIIIMDAQSVGNAWGNQFRGVWGSFSTAWQLGATNAGAWGALYLNMPIPSWYAFPAPNPGPNQDVWDRAVAPAGASWSVDNGAMEGQFRFRHNNNTTANFLFADGHAGGMRYKKFAFGGSELEWRNILPDGGN
jgi:prepilin-type processing-associated H-X9-DG protein